MPNISRHSDVGIGASRFAASMCPVTAGRTSIVLLPTGTAVWLSPCTATGTVNPVAVATPIRVAAILLILRCLIPGLLASADVDTSKCIRIVAGGIDSDQYRYTARAARVQQNARAARAEGPNRQPN